MIWYSMLDVDNYQTKNNRTNSNAINVTAMDENALFCV